MCCNFIIKTCARVFVNYNCNCELISLKNLKFSIFLIFTCHKVDPCSVFSKNKHDWLNELLKTVFSGDVFITINNKIKIFILKI